MVLPVTASITMALPVSSLAMYRRLPSALTASCFGIGYPAQDIHQFERGDIHHADAIGTLVGRRQFAGIDARTCDG